jgi:hypothetical protein
MPEKVTVEGQRYNVEETFPLFDTVGVTGYLDTIQPTPPGWFPTFAAMGAANEISFFNVRNKATCGRAYNNQETRDQTAWGYLLRAIGVQFFAPPSAIQIDDDSYQEGLHSPIWEADLPIHSSLTLQINQDDYLKINSQMVGAGVGPTFGGYGQYGTLSVSGTGVAQGAQTIGEPMLRNMWHFPDPIGIPRRAAISARIKFSEYARQLLQALTGPHSHQFYTPAFAGTVLIPAFFGIRVILVGQRLVQQRGELHA